MLFPPNNFLYPTPLAYPILPFQINQKGNHFTLAPFERFFLHAHTHTKGKSKCTSTNQFLLFSSPLFNRELPKLPYLSFPLP